MQELLFLAHRIPYPPDKGDKIRAWNFLEHLAQRYKVHLGCFIDDPHDWRFTDVLRRICSECCFVHLRPDIARLRSLRALPGGHPLTLAYYSDRKLHRWARDIMSRPELAMAFVYCSAMTQYVPARPGRPLRRIADIVDVDSEKWLEYADRTAGPRRWLYRREGATLRRVERRITSAFDLTIVATSAEMTLLQELAPEARDRVACVRNGVDGDYFSPDRPYESPYPRGVAPLVFVGAMDYWPNVDAVCHFAQAVFPLIREHLPGTPFFVVGAKPSYEVGALTSAHDIVVTGRVADVRPYLAHASAVVAPLRIGRGVQNKVLEGMAMGKPVIASAKALAGINVDIENDVFLADTPGAFAQATCRAVTTDAGTAVGRNARKRVMADYAWSTSFEQLDALLKGRKLV